MVGDKFPKGIIVFLFCDAFFSHYKTGKYYIKDASDVQLFFLFFFPSTFSVLFFPSPLGCYMGR